MPTQLNESIIMLFLLKVVISVIEKLHTIRYILTNCFVNVLLSSSCMELLKSKINFKRL